MKNRHVLCLGDDDTVCSRCGFDLSKRPDERFSFCPDNLPSETQKLITAALLRGYKESRRDAVGLINGYYETVTKGLFDGGLITLLGKLRTEISSLRSKFY